MKKQLKILSAALAFVMSFSLMAACAPEDEPTPGPNPGPDPGPVELEPGTITFEDKEYSVERGKEDPVKLEATASNGAEVTYSMTEEQAAFLEEDFDGAYTLEADGTISGTYSGASRGGRYEITASAEKCDPVTAEITLRPIDPYLTFEGGQLPDGRKDVEYAASVVSYVEENEELSFRVVEGELPEGLTMSSDGTITGTPTTVGRAEPFTVRASAEGYSNTEAEFMIDVIIYEESAAQGRIINFGGEVVTLDTLYVGSNYASQDGISGRAVASNGNMITYTLTEGKLPEGLTLYPNGALIGTTEELGEYTFTITASAAGCDPVTAEFKLPVLAEQVIFTTVNGVLVRGEAANYDIAVAETSTGAAITYSMEASAAAKLKETWGLEVTPDGKVTGTPKASTKTMSFDVIASAEGYTSATATMIFRIKEPLQAAANNIFEAEYTDLSGKDGTGYSGSPNDEGLIARQGGEWNVSNELYVSYLHNEDVTLEFVIYAEEDTDAAIYLSLGSELQNITLTPEVFGVVVYNGTDTPTGNGTDVQYSAQTVQGGGVIWQYGNFREYSFGTAHLTAGYNVIQIQIRPNTFRNGATGGPGVDYLRLDASGLTWSPCLYNEDLTTA